jgi:uncharacterized protein YbaA (DUF1428 family)
MVVEGSERTTNPTREVLAVPLDVDGFVLPVPRKNLPAYRRIARKAGGIWREHGALEDRECVGDDLHVKMGVPFPRRIRLKRGETGGVLLDRVPIARRSRSRQRQGHEGPATHEDDRSGLDAVRLQTHGGFTVMVDV